MSEKKNIHVVAALIVRGQQIFATQRGYGPYKDWWEFPGGKIEAGETPQEALKREIREELAADITVGAFCTQVVYDYPEFHLIMDCYWAQEGADSLQLLEHEAARWLPMEDLRQVQWLPADLLVLEAIENDSVFPIFAYGTLMTGRRNYGSYLAPLEPICEGTVSGYRLFDLGSYPGAIPGDGLVKGQVFLVNRAQFIRLDWLEEEGLLYRREWVRVFTEDQREVPAYLYRYLGNTTGKKEIALDEQPYKG